MTEPENATPAAESETPIFDATAAAAEAEESPAELAADAQLRLWAKANGIEDVPANGRLSAAWREQITAAMTAALVVDPKEEASAETTSTESSDSSSSETTTETPSDGPTEEEPKAEVKLEPALPNIPEFETGTYRSVFYPPNTFVSSQYYTS